METHYQPHLNLVYLPHLDYNLQRIGPNHPDIQDDLSRIDSIVGNLVDFLDQRGVQSLILSEYGITPVKKPIHLNRLLRQSNRFLSRLSLRSLKGRAIAAGGLVSTTISAIVPAVIPTIVPDIIPAFVSAIAL